MRPRTASLRHRHVSATHHYAGLGVRPQHPGLRRDHRACGREAKATPAQQNTTVQKISTVCSGADRSRGRGRGASHHSMGVPGVLQVAENATTPFV